MEKKLVKLK